MSGEASVPFSERTYPPPPRAKVLACPNCHAVMPGNDCAVCGTPARADQLQDHAREWWQRAFGDRVLWGSVWLVLRHPGQLTLDWWEGRRAGRMSPVRMLFVALLLSSVVTIGEARLFGAVDPQLGAMIHSLIYTLAGCSVAVTLTILPGLLPPDRQRTLYQHATFALYEASFFSLLLLWGFLSQLLLAVVPPPQLAAARIVLAPLALIGMGGFIVHPVAHMRRAYGVSWRGAAWRTALLFAGSVAAIVIVSTLLDQMAARRAADPASQSSPAGVRFGQMKPNPDLPTFSQVREELAGE